MQPIWILRYFGSPPVEFHAFGGARRRIFYMHEMGIALEIIDIVRNALPGDVRKPKVETVHLKVGKLSAVVVSSLRFCFEVASEDTPLAGAELVVEEIAVEACCNDCGHRWTIDGPAFLCESCSSGSLSLLSGRELDVQSFQVIEEENDHAD
jgi:hydrogenase nickel incorporation protein HypA/HybF